MRPARRGFRQGGAWQQHSQGESREWLSWPGREARLGGTDGADSAAASAKACDVERWVFDFGKPNFPLE